MLSMILAVETGPPGQAKSVCHRSTIASRSVFVYSLRLGYSTLLFPVPLPLVITSIRLDFFSPTLAVCRSSISILTKYLDSINRLQLLDQSRILEDTRHTDTDDQKSMVVGPSKLICQSIFSRLVDLRSSILFSLFLGLFILFCCRFDRRK